jgi:hypothetical protein
MAITKVSNELIAINAIHGTLIADNAITAVHIATNAVSGTLIADNALTAVHIATDAVTPLQIQADAVTAAKLATNAVVTASIVAGSVTATELGADAVTAAKIGDDVIDSEHYAAGSIDAAHLADDAVTIAKMAALTRGSIIAGDSSGAPAALAVGSNGQILTSDGTDITWGADVVLTTEQVQDIAGGMFTGNTETGITATYQDGDGTVDLVVGTLNQDTTGLAGTATALATARTIGGTSFDGTGNIAVATATLATNITASDNSSTNETVYPVFVDGQTGSQGIETDGGLIYNPSSGMFQATTFGGNLTGTINTAAQTNITSVGTLSSLTVTGAATASTSAKITQVAITSSSSAVAWDAAAAANAYHLTTENTTFSAPSNATEGAIISVEIAQGGTARTIAWNTVFEFAASTAPTITATASKTDIMTFRYNGSVWQEIGRVQNLAQT